MIASRFSALQPPPKPSAVSARPSSCKAPVTAMLAATANTCRLMPALQDAITALVTRLEFETAGHLARVRNLSHDGFTNRGSLRNAAGLKRLRLIFTESRCLRDVT